MRLTPNARSTATMISWHRFLRDCRTRLTNGVIFYLIMPNADMSSAHLGVPAARSAAGTVKMQATKKPFKKLVITEPSEILKEI